MNCDRFSRDIKDNHRVRVYYGICFYSRLPSKYHVPYFFHVRSVRLSSTFPGFHPHTDRTSPLSFLLRHVRLLLRSHLPIFYSSLFVYTNTCTHPSPPSWYISTRPLTVPKSKLRLTLPFDDHSRLVSSPH